MNLIETLETRRLLFAGQFETTFGVGGETSLPGLNDTTRVEQVVATFTDSNTGLENMVLRLNGDRFVRLDIGGRVIEEFDNGKLELDLDFTDYDVIDSAFDVMSQRFVVLGQESVGGETVFTLRMFNVDGDIDESFGAFSGFGGPRSHLDPDFQNAQKVSFRNDSSIAVAGIANVVDGVNISDGDLIVSVYRSDGILTAGFATKTFTDTEAIDITALEVDRNNILYVGLTDEQFDGFVTADRAHLARIGFDGEFNDANDLITYDADGTTREDVMLDVFDTDGTAEGIRVLLATDTDSAVSNDFAAEQALTAETLTIDAPFDTGTPALALQDPTEFVVVTDAQFDSAGRVVAVGLRDGEPLPFASTRFTAAGTYDLTYGSTGFTEFAGRPVLLDDARVLNTDSNPIDGGDPVLGLLQAGAGQVVGGDVIVERSGSRATIIGSSGNDSIRVSFRASDSRYVIRGNGVTSSIPDVAGISVSLGEGNDELIFAPGVVLGSVAAPTLGVFAGPGDDTIRGSAGSDSVLGETGDDFLYGFGGDDYLFGGSGNDLIFGGDGGDYAEGGAGNDSLNGNAQNDRLLGNAGSDTLNGAGGNDFLFGGSSADDIRGGAGNDKAANDVLDTYDSVEELLA